MSVLYTKKGYRAKLQSVNAGKALHWLFLPGGPGLGSELFSDLGLQLSLPGNAWLIDYPNDGSNQIFKENDFNSWRDGLIELLEAFDNIVIVAHSFSGMFVLSDPRIESQIKGLVLLNTSPNAKWMQSILQQAKQYQLPDLSSIQARYQDHPSNTLFKALTMACAPYFFSESDLEFGKAMLETLPYSHASYDWVGQYFHPNYEAKWIPKDTPTLIVGSELDHITPLSLFKNDKRWQKKNIVIECIEDAGHISWMTSVDKIKVLFDQFITKM